MDTLKLVPVGHIDSDFLHHLGKQLTRIIPLRTVVAQAVDPPAAAYNFNRHQYNSTQILRHLLPLRSKFDKLLAVTDQDLYTEGLNFVFGEAHPAQGVAIISLARLRQEFYGFAENPELLFQRVLKEAVHELGHLYGLPHCSNPECVMYFSNTLADTDRKTARFCSRCLAKLEGAK